MSSRVSISGRYALGVFAAVLCLSCFPLPETAHAQISVGRSDWTAQGRIPSEELAIIEQQLGEVAGGANLKLQSIGACAETTCTLASLAGGQSRYLYLQIEDAEDKGMRVRIRVVDALNNRPLATRSVFIQKNDRRGTKSALEVTIRDVAFHLFGPPVPEALKADAERKLAMQAPLAPQPPAQSQPAWAGQPASVPEVRPVSAPAAEPPRAVQAVIRPTEAPPLTQRPAPPPPAPVVETPAPRPVVAERPVPEAAPPAPAPVRAPEPPPVQVQAEPAPEPTRPAPSRSGELDHTASDRIVPDKIDIPYLP